MCVVEALFHQHHHQAMSAKKPEEEKAHKFPGSIWGRIITRAHTKLLGNNCRDYFAVHVMEFFFYSRKPFWVKLEDLKKGLALKHDIRKCNV